MTNNRFRLLVPALLLAAAVLNVLDLLTTILVLRLGVAREVDPLSRFVLEHAGTLGGVIVKVIPSLAIVFAVIIFWRECQTMKPSTYWALLILAIWLNVSLGYLVFHTLTFIYPSSF